MDQNYTLEEFKKTCQEKHCPRYQAKANNCKLESKQERCFQKIKIKQEEISEEKNKLKEIKTQIRIRDKSTCLVLKCLTINELNLFIELNKKNLWQNSRKDNAHILPQSKYPEFKYDVDNIFTCGRFFHSRLDNYQDLITGVFIGDEGRKKWIEKIMIRNNLWSEDMTYDKFLQFKQEKR
jgi:hypothetical protein